MSGDPQRPELNLVRPSYSPPSFGTAVSNALLTRIARGELPATLRLHRPGRELAFAKQDRVAAGFDGAVASARAAGFAPVIRMAGGRAAAFHEGTLAVAWSRPDPRPVARIRERFEEAAEIIAGALRGVGVDARIGEIPGEWCPGTWSVGARGGVKLAGIGQRMVAGAAHIGAVVVVDRADLVRAALEPVYRALGLEWDVETAGSIASEVGPVGLGQVEDALIDELRGRFDLREVEVDPATLNLARELEPLHRTP